MAKKLLRMPRVESDEEEEDEEESEDEEDDADLLQPSAGGGKRPRVSLGMSKQNKRSKHNSFFDDEADDDDDDDEEGGGEGEQLDEQAREMMMRQDRRRQMQGGSFFDRSVKDIARNIEERHRKTKRSSADRAAAYYAEEEGPESAPAVAQQSLVPSVSDPSFWMVNCLNGKEQELVYQIMNKCISMARKGTPLGITGAIAAQSKGRIFVESYSEPAVMEAVSNIRGLYPGKMQLVPIADMTTVMSVVSTKKPVKKNEWVRMTRGHYKDDLALVMEVKESGLKCIVQCVPRLDLTVYDMSPEEARIRKRTVRPPRRFYQSQDIINIGRTPVRQRFPGTMISCDYFEGNYFYDGYLLKEVTVGSMVKPCGESNPPSLEELQSFRRKPKSNANDDDFEDGENQGSKMAASLLDELSDLQGQTNLGAVSSSGQGLLTGDTVEVVEGDLLGLRGKLVSHDGTTVKIKPLETSIDLGGATEIEFLISQVRKHIEVGAHVKVMDGRYINETGTIVAVEQLGGESDFTAIILTDVTSKEISVRVSQLRESAEIASGQDKLQGYELYDLVVLSGGGSANEVGVIVRVGREDFTVINNHGVPREVRPEELRGKRNSTSSRAVAIDAQSNQIRVGDTVAVADGPHKGKTATIKRINRTQLFLHSQTRPEHAGIFVVRNRSVVLAGSRSKNNAGAESSNAFGAQTKAAAPMGRGRSSDALVGKTVRIKAGKWKGYLGMCADANPTHVQVELHSRLKKVMVLRENVAVVGDKFGATEDTNYASNPLHPMAPTTPYVHPGQTPMHGGATPMHKSGESETGEEVWRPGGTIDIEPAMKENQGDFDGWGSVAQEPTESWKPSAREDSFGGPSLVKRDQTSSIDADAGDKPTWFVERVYVKRKTSDSIGFIKDIDGATASIELEDGGTEKIHFDELEPVEPKDTNSIIVIDGDEIGLEGVQVAVDGQDTIIQTVDGAFKIVNKRFVVRIKG